MSDHTWHEIQSQPAAWEATLHEFHQQSGALASFFKRAAATQIIVIGCGSTYYLALSAAMAWREIAGIAAIGLPASEIWLALEEHIPRGQPALLIAVSRSGATSETIRAVEAFRAAGRGLILTLSCYPDAPLAALGDYNLVLPAGQEHSIAQTRAFSSLYLASVALAVQHAQRADLLADIQQLPRFGSEIIASSQPLAQALAEQANLTRCYFLGSGARYGLACELSLKCKEMSLSESEPFHFLEFRHGPQSMVDSNTLIIGLLSQRNQVSEQAVLDEMQALGARVVAIGVQGEVVLPVLAEQISGVLYLLFGQLFAYLRAIRKGLTPDQPHQLTAVVRLPG
jgi:glutamine---fructose-6-phosphate transaminase (isomerizing)